MRKNGEKKVIIFLILILIIIAGVFAFIKINDSKDSIKLEVIEEADVKYYVLRKENKYGVIDKEGNIVVEPKYAEIIIPNPTKDVFLYSENATINNSNFSAMNMAGDKLFGDYESVCAIDINQLSSYVPYEKTVLKYKKGNLYGLVNLSGEKVTDAIYEEIQGIDYKEGYLKAKKNGFYGVIDINGKSVIKNEYDDIESDGYYNEDIKYSKAGFILRIKTDDGYKYGYATNKGKILKDAMFNSVNRLTDIDDSKNIYFVATMNGKSGLYKNNKIVIKNEFDDIIYDISSKLLLVQNGNGEGVYNLDGKCIVPIDYENIIIGGDYINASKGEKKLVFDLNGKEVNTDNFSHTKVSDKYSIIIDNDNNYNIVDNSNNKLLKDNFVYIEYFKEDLFIATKDSKTGVINSNGNVVAPISYGTVQRINGTDLLEAIKLENNEIDLINVSGNVIKGIENATLEVEDNYIKLYSDTDVKYFDLNGNEVNYKKLYPNNTIFADKQNGKWGFVDANGNKVIDYKYDFVTEQFGNFVGVKQDGKWGVLTVTGQNVLKPTYKFDYNNVRFISQYFEVKNGLGVSMFSADAE